MKLRYRFTKNFSFKEVIMIVANENHTRLNHWVTFQINVENIKRMIWVFVNSRSIFIKLLLKMLWFKFVNVVIMIKQKIIKIENKNQMKIFVNINFYRMIFEKSTINNKKKIFSQKQLTRLKKIFKHVVVKNQQHAKMKTESKYSKFEESSEKFFLTFFEFENENFQ